MTSYVFSIINKQIVWSKVHEILKSKFGSDFEMVFALKEENEELAALEKLQKKHKNVVIVVCKQNASENEMINKAIKEVSGDNMVLCRDYFEYATVLSDYIVAMGYMGAQLVLFRKKEKTSKFKDFIKKIYNKIVSWLFGFKLYEGDIGLMFFGNIALSVLKELPNTAHYTKVNRFLGFDISYVESEELQKPKFEQKERKRVVAHSIISAALVILETVAFALLIVFDLLGFIGGLVLILLIVCSIFYLFYTIIKITILNQYGDLS